MWTIMELFWQLMGLFVSALLSATLLPMASEAVFAAVWYAQQDWAIWVWLTASLGNTLGSLITYAMGFRLPENTKIPEKSLKYLQKYGVWVLLCAWLPIVGDALPLAAGWLRLNFYLSSFMILLGKMGRYAVIGWGVGLI